MLTFLISLDSLLVIIFLCANGIDLYTLVKDFGPIIAPIIVFFLAYFLVDSKLQENRKNKALYSCEVILDKLSTFQDNYIEFQKNNPKYINTYFKKELISNIRNFNSFSSLNTEYSEFKGMPNGYIESYDSLKNSIENELNNANVSHDLFKKLVKFNSSLSKNKFALLSILVDTFTNSDGTLKSIEEIPVSDLRDNIKKYKDEPVSTNNFENEMKNLINDLKSVTKG